MTSSVSSFTGASTRRHSFRLGSAWRSLLSGAALRSESGVADHGEVCIVVLDDLHVVIGEPHGWRATERQPRPPQCGHPGPS
jgi:hypothetical protein